MKRRGKFKQVVVVTGTPGVGKTIVSEKLASTLDALHINVGDVVKREKLTSGYDPKRRTVIADKDRLARWLQQIIEKHEGDVIVDGHYATTVAPKGQVTKVFVLRCHPQQLKRQMVKRGFRGAKLWENLAAEILDVCLYDAVLNMGLEKVCEIDTTNKAVDETVSEITAVLEGKKKCTTGTIDWIGQLEREHSLERYLKHF